MLARAFERKQAWAWLAISAVFLGLTAAAKYLYALVGIAILIQWAWMLSRGDEPFDRKRLARCPPQSQIRNPTFVCTAVKHFLYNLGGNWQLNTEH